MVRASLPTAGVAAVLLVASAAVGQTPSPFDEYSSPFILATSAEVIWEDPAETPPPLELVEDGLVMSFDAAPPQDSKRIKPTPQKGGQTKEPPSTACPDGDCDGVLEDFPTFCCLPFAAPYPQQQQQGCSGRKCHRRKRGGCQNNNCGGNGNSGGNPYLSWPYGPSGCPGFCAPPQQQQQQKCGGRRCHRNKGGCNGGGCNNGGGSGYGYGGYGGYPGAWGGFGGDGGLGCGGFCGYYPPPTQQQGCGCRKCQRKHHSRGQSCPRCGYPNGGGYGNAWAFPVPGWSVDCNDGCSGKHHGLFRRCHSNQQQPQQPCPYSGMQQPCFMDGDFSF